MIVFKIEDPSALQAAISELAKFLEQAGVSAEKIFDSKLAACELVANELKHAKSETALRGEIVDGHIVLKISSKTPFQPTKITCSDVHSEHGRGLFLVNELCEGKMTFEGDGIKVKIKIEM